MTININSVEALALWRKTLEVIVKGKNSYDFSTRQLLILLEVYFSETPFTVRALALKLKVSKPAITRALNRLSHMGLVKRKPDPADKRSILVQRTVKGSVFLSEFGDSIVECAKTI